MLDADSIHALTEAESISAAETAINTAMGGTGHGLVGLPESYKVTDLERYLPKRRHLRGRMSTPALADFAAYATAHAEAGATIFIAPAAMEATAVLNLGAPGVPGHADNLAVYKPPMTAAFEALLKHTGGPLGQRTTAEFLEDWHVLADISFSNGEGSSLAPAKAISAVRQITLESAKKVESRDAQLSAARSSFESITASSEHGLPATMVFTCAPHLGMQPR